MAKNTSSFVCGLLVVSGLFLLILSGGFYLAQPDVLALWPWQDGRLSYIFIASILAAIAAPILWMGVSGELAAMRAGAIDFAVTYLGLALTLLVGWNAASGLVSVSLYLTIVLVSLVFNLALFVASRNLAFTDQRPVPPLLRYSFLLFFGLLVLVGTALLFRYSNVFPWPLKPQSSIVFGWIFLGAAAFFLYGFRYPVWGNMRGQLYGFLAYDLVLLLPFLEHFFSVKPEHQLSLYVYTAVIIYSALLSIYYLFVYKPDPKLGQ